MPGLIRWWGGPAGGQAAEVVQTREEQARVAHHLFREGKRAGGDDATGHQGVDAEALGGVLLG